VALTPDRVQAYRVDYRNEIIPSRYHGWRHLATITGICVAAIAIALARMDSITWRELLIVPTAWIFSNLAEYAVHRGPMHHLTALERLYKRHTSQHHRFFSREMMAVDSTRDFHVTLFPPWLSLFFVGLIGVPMAMVVYLLFGHDVALLFYAAVVFYYMFYEWVHLGAHLPTTSLLARAPLIRFARVHHGLHHDPGKMRRANFNFAIPLGDWLFGTWER
jgi:hypothetical protein